MSSNKSNKQKPSNIASGSLKDIEKKRKQVFKPILDNPFTQSNLWPFIESELANNILDLLSSILSNLGQYNKLISEEKKSNNNKFVKPDVPQIRKEITIGFNSTVKVLEKQASIHRSRINNKKIKLSDDSSYIKYVFVAKYDISPSLLTQPFPVLSFTSSRSADDRVKLVQLPRGSMDRLSTILNIENTGILGFSKEIREAQALYNLIEENVKDVEIPWLVGLFSNDLTFFQKPSLKFLSTTAPILSKKNIQKDKNKVNKVKQGK